MESPLLSVNGLKGLKRSWVIYNSLGGSHITILVSLQYKNLLVSAA